MIYSLGPLSPRPRSLAWLKGRTAGGIAVALAGLYACGFAMAGVSGRLSGEEPRRPVDLVEALGRVHQAGGEIAVIAAKDGTPVARRSPDEARDHGQEMAIRLEAWEIARRVNFSAQPGEINPRSLPLTAEQTALLKRFALSDAGAVWFRQLADDSIRMFNRGHLAYDAKTWKRLRQGKRPVRLSRLLTGRLTEKGLFAREPQPFKFYAFAGQGALAEPASIGLGDRGFRCRFPDGGQEVDPHAILSHEFGHTRYGDPASALSLEGEARTVELYENPVRQRNGYEPRRTYYVRLAGAPEQERKGYLERVFNWQSRTRIDLDDHQVVREVHCDCLQPIAPLTLDCELRRLPVQEDSLAQPRYETHCTPRLRLPEEVAGPVVEQGPDAVQTDGIGRNL